MLNDNSLSERLNAVRNGNPLPKPSMHPQSLFSIAPPKVAFNMFIITKGLNMLDTFIASFFYGFAIKTIFALDWSWFGAFCVGFLMNHVISLFPRVLFPRFFSPKSPKN